MSTEKRWTFEANVLGYMLYFDGKPQGGAGVAQKPKHWRHQRQNVKDFSEQARTQCDRLNEAGAVPDRSRYPKYGIPSIPQSRTVSLLGFLREVGRAKG